MISVGGFEIWGKYCLFFETGCMELISSGFIIVYLCILQIFMEVFGIIADKPQVGRSKIFRI
jgi:hypothetical protein